MRPLASAAARRSFTNGPLIAPTFTFTSARSCRGTSAVYGERSGVSSGPMKLARMSVATRSNIESAGRPSISSMVLSMDGWL